MSNIEDDIKILKDKDCLWVYPEDDILKAQEHILSEREQDKSRIKELEEENKQKDMLLQMAKEVVENSIAKKKVRDKIELLKRLRPKNIKKEVDFMYKDGYFTGGIDCLEALLLEELLKEGE